MLKQFGSFLGWLSGSLAAISAFLYALGYFATMSEDRLLGISFAVATRTPEFYIERGGNIVMRAVLLGVWPVLGLVLLGIACRRLSGRIDPRANASLATAGRILRAAAPPAAALGMLALMFVAMGKIVVPALGVRELLFLEPGAKAGICRDADELSRAIYTLNRDALSGWFADYALFAGAVTGLGIVFRPALLRDAQGLWLSTAVLAGFMTLVGLPLAYGILAADKSAPVATISPALDVEGEAPVRLLARTEQGILVWIEGQPVVKWVSLRRIDTLGVSRPEKITTISCDSVAPPEGG